MAPDGDGGHQRHDHARRDAAADELLPAALGAQALELGVGLLLGGVERAVDVRAGGDVG